MEDIATVPDLRVLAAAALRGEAGARDAFTAACAPLVTRTVRLIVGSGTWDAEDAAQEALADVARSIGSLRDADAAPAWVLRIATRRAVRAARRSRLRERLLVRDEWADVADPATAAQSLGELGEAFRALPPRTRAVAVLRLYVGLTEQETADALGCSPGTVKSQLHAARARLAATIERSRRNG
jgi:RNA polymerase sigma factor (sigma-70 family)